MLPGWLTSSHATRVGIDTSCYPGGYRHLLLPGWLSLPATRVVIPPCYPGEYSCYTGGVPPATRVGVLSCYTGGCPPATRVGVPPAVYPGGVPPAGITVKRDLIPGLRAGITVRRDLIPGLRSGHNEDITPLPGVEERA